MSCEEITLIQNSDGLFEEYDNTYDITIHCKTEEEQKKNAGYVRKTEMGSVY